MRFLWQKFSSMDEEKLSLQMQKLVLGLRRNFSR